MPKQPSNEASIIKIIQDMVQEGESEEKIVATLKELGVEAAKAKRLLLLGQADTFALLRNEITKIAKEDVANEIPELKKLIVSEGKKNSDSLAQEIKSTVRTDYETVLSRYEQQLQEQKKSFAAEKQRFSETMQATQADFRKRAELVQAEMDKLVAKYGQRISRTQENFEKLLALFEQNQQQKQQYYQELLNKNDEKVAAALQKLEREVEKKKKRFEEIRGLSEQEAQEKARAFEKELAARVDRATGEFSKFERVINAAEANLAKGMKEQVETAIDLSSRVREKLNELGEQVYQAQADLDEMKAAGVGSRNRITSLALVLLGIAFCIGSLYLFFVTFSAAATVDAIIMTVVIALIGITMLFVSTVI